MAEPTATWKLEGNRRPKSGKRKRPSGPKDKGTPMPNNTHAYKRAMPKLPKGERVTDKKLKSKLKRHGQQARSAAYQAARSEVLLPEAAGSLEAEGMERTYHFTQQQIVDEVDMTSGRKVFDLTLDELGPYTMRYTRNGRNLLLGGRKGHVATLDWKTGSLGCEVQLAETVRDVTWLHNNTMFAVAQKRFVYVYDDTGAEAYVLRKHVDPTRLEFLPYHYLLASVGNAGWLKYHDVSVGKLVVEHKTRLGPCKAMRQNPHNAVLHLGHTNGTVTLWTPNLSTFAVKALCHRGPVQTIAVDSAGKYMATAGLDGQMKLWDIRMFKDQPLQQYYTPTPASCIDISQRHMLAVCYGPHVQVWKGALQAKQKSPLMSHMVPGAAIEQCRFAPFEDVLGLSHSKGFSSILVPGAGEPNYDALETNIYETKSQRREADVKRLLEKVPSALITLNPDEILKVKTNKPALPVDDPAPEQEAAGPEKKAKKKARGRNSAKLRFLRKKRNVIDGKREALKEKLEKEQRDRLAAKNPAPVRKRTALDRFGASA